MQRLTNMERQNMERWLILVTAKLKEMGQAVGAEHVRNKELVQQLELLAQAAAHKDQTAPGAAPVAATQPAAKTEPVAVAETPAAPAAGEAIDHRMTQLEQSIAGQLKALSDQINAMKQVDVSARVIPLADPVVPAPVPGN